MDILIQCEKTKLFLAPGGKWTATQKQALSFCNSPSALGHCLQNQLREVLLLFCYPNPELNFTIAPFSETEPSELTSFSALRDSVYFQAQNLQIRKENRHLRNELDSIIAEGKERRKRHAFTPLFRKPPKAHTEVLRLSPNSPPPADGMFVPKRKRPPSKQKVSAA